jgi:hypothetical protein
MRETMQKFKLLFYWCVLPAVLIYVGWFLYDATGNSVQNEAALHNRLAEFRTLAAKNPLQTVQYGGKTMYASRASSSAQEDLHRLEQDKRYLTVRANIALAIMASAVLSFVIGVQTLLRSWLDGRAALRSRERFIEVFEQLRRRLARRLVLYSLVLAVPMSLIAAYSAYWAAPAFPDDGRFVIAAIVISPIGWAIYAVLRAVLGPLRKRATLSEAPQDLLGRELSRADAPGLWWWVDGVAAKLKALPPEHIVTGLTGGFFVTSHSMTLRPEARTITGRILHLPLAFVSMMSRDEVSSILGHELAHFSGNDTQYSLRLQPLYASMIKNVESFLVVDEEDEIHFLKAPGLSLAIFILERLETAENHWRRERELVADSVSCRVVDARTSALALLRNVALTDVIEELTSQAHRVETSDIISTLIGKVQKDGLMLPTAELEPRLPHPTDTHPPVRQRIEAMGVPLSNALLAEAMRTPTTADTSWFNALLVDASAQADA